MVFLIIVIMFLSICPSQNLLPRAAAQASVKREVTIPVKVVLVGVDPATVDTSYMKWNFNLPTTTFGQVLSPQPNITGVVYKVDYNFTFASDSFKSKLESYLHSIEVVKQGPNPWFYYYVGEPSGYVSTSNFYDMQYVTYDEQS